LLFEVEEQRAALEPLLDREAQEFIEVLEEYYKDREDAAYDDYLENDRD
jgi:hypothetical protein